MMTISSAKAKLKALEAEVSDAEALIEFDSAASKRRRRRYLDRCMTKEGAIAAVRQIAKHGVTESDDPINMWRWFAQYLRLLTDCRVAVIIITGSAQSGKSLGAYLSAVFVLLEGRLNIAWFYATRTSLINQQPEQFKPIARRYAERLGVDDEIERDSVFRWRIKGATANFSHLGGKSRKDGKAEAGAETVGFPGSAMAYVDERSQVDASVDITPRLEASPIPSKPRRELGTPGGGAGIEVQIKRCERLFCPAVVCSNCGETAFLDPKGALLKPIRDPKTGKARYFSPRGELLDWWGRDPDNPDDPRGAYIACSHCGHPIEGEQVLRADMVCKKTGESVNALLNRLPDGEVYSPFVGVYISPLTKAGTKPNLAVDLIRDGLTTLNINDYQQQKLGHESETLIDGITLEAIQESYARHGNITRGDRTVTVAGCDQGRGEYWLWIERVHTLKGKEVCREVVLAEAIASDDLLDLLARFNVQFCLIDNEPEIEEARNLAIASGGKVALANQVASVNDFDKGKVQTGSRTVPVWRIRSGLFLEQVAAGFADPILYRITGRAHRKMERHLLAVRRDPVSGRWVRPDNHDDDLMFAAHFARAAYTIHKRVGSGGGI